MGEYGLKSNGSGGWKLTVFPLTAVTRKLMASAVSKLETPMLCTKGGFSPAPIFMRPPTAYPEVSSTVMVELPRVAPERMGRLACGGGQSAEPKLNAGPEVTVKIVAPWPAPRTTT